MADAFVSNQPVVTLKLSENEARYIKSISQNSMYDNPVLEPPLEKQTREAIWNSLDKAGVK